MNNRATKIVTLPPSNEDFALTSKMWLAIGVLAGNHRFITNRPAALLTRSQVGPAGMTEQRRDAMERGLAAAISLEGMQGMQRAAFITLAKAMLNPLGIAISAHGIAPPERNNCNQAPRYLLLEDVGSAENYASPEPPATIRAVPA